MQLKAFEKTADTLTFRWTTRGYGWACIAFMALALGMPQIFVSIDRPIVYLLCGLALLAGIVSLYIGGVHTHTIDGITKTFTQHIKSRLRNTTHTWHFQEIKEVTVVSKIFSTRSGPGYYEYWICMVMSTGKKIKLNKQRDVERAGQIRDMLQRYIFRS